MPGPTMRNGSTSSLWGRSPSRSDGCTVLLDAADAGWESGQVGRANNLLKEARQSACSESEPGRVDHYMEGSKPGQGRRFSMDAARSGARSRIRPAPLRRISYPSEGVPGSHANGRSSTGQRQVQPVFQLSRAPRGLVADHHVLTWAPARR